MMMRLRLSGVAGFAVLTLALSAGAQDLDSTATLSGQIVAKDELRETFSVQTETGERVTFDAGEQNTRFHAGAEPLSFADLRVGDEVTVRVTQSSQGGLTPQEPLDVERPPAGEPPAGTELRDEPEPGLGAEPSFEEEEPAEELPGTASPLALLAVLGGSALGSGLALRERRS
jgi:hypothetical protein